VTATEPRREIGQPIWLILACVVVPELVVTYWASLRFLPGFSHNFALEDPYDTDGDWFGHPPWLAQACGVALVLAIYLMRYVLLRLRLSPHSSALVYALAVAISLPFIWFFVVNDWYGEFAYRINCWFAYPIGFWFVPTVSFLAGLRIDPAERAADFVRMASIECLFFMPLWMLCWALFAFWVGAGAVMLFLNCFGSGLGW
jgi:hypothetical protein